MTLTLSTIPSLHARFDRAFPPHMQQALLRCLLDAYEATSRHAAGLDPLMMNQAFCYTRWIEVDSALLAFGRRFKNEGVEYEFVKNTDTTPVSHAELRRDGVIITATCVMDRSDLPRSAAYRDNLAASNDYVLFAPKESDPATLWAPLLHVPCLEERRPRGVYIAFPTGSEKYAAEHIDLLGRYQGASAAPVEVLDVVVPRLVSQAEQAS